MKLLLCAECGDVVKLDYHERSCACEKASGRYIDNKRAEIRGPTARCIGLANPDVIHAVRFPHHPTIRCWMMDPERAPNLTALL